MLEAKNISKINRNDVKDFYSQAALSPQSSLCCPTNYQPEDIAHIPEEVLKISYGCGSPVNKASIKKGDTVVDLGSGGGIDCFIAAKIAGKTGRVIGIDMTDEMLSKANEHKKRVACNLGYSNIEFRKGHLEDIQVESASADIVVSNCVINLSTKKEKVFEEIFRILKNQGRFVISDIVSDKNIPEKMRFDKQLWGECIAGAITQKSLIDISKAAKFYGISVEHDYVWKVIDGITFSSITLRGWKFTNSSKCDYKGQYAIYKGPFQSVSDDENHTFPIGEPVEICADTTAKLIKPPYAGNFIIVDPSNNNSPQNKSSQECGPNCC
jgi:SAM-dependent methyltransferase